MTRHFADSFYFLALLNERDEAHRNAVEYSRSSRTAVITTRWVLAEVADALSDAGRRGSAGAFIEHILSSSGFQVIGDSDELFERGLQLYRSRADKGWSLTDCISFVVMTREKIADALTADHHFEQAGYNALLRAV